MRGKSFFFGLFFPFFPQRERKEKEGRGLFFPCLHTSPHSSSVLAEGSDAQEVSFTLKKKSVCVRANLVRKGVRPDFLAFHFSEAFPVSLVAPCSAVDGRTGRFFFPCAVRQRGRGRYFFCFRR